jgi:hypothetical protein
MKRLKTEDEKPARRADAPIRSPAKRFLVSAGVAALAASSEGFFNYGSPIPSAFTLR